MRFGKHIGKGLWAFADKALPAIYGIGFIFLVVRVLPEKEYGAFAVLQSIFTIVTALAFSLAQQPLTKFAAETSDNGAYIVASFVFNLLFFVVISAGALLFNGAIADLLDPNNREMLTGLIGFLPVMLVATLFRGLAVSLLQADYRIQKIFWIDAVYFLGTMALVFIAGKLHHFSTATDLVRLNTIGLALSSVLSVILIVRQLRVKLAFRRDAFAKMWDFGKYNVGSNANYLIYSQMDVFIVSRYAGVVVLASYSAAKIITRVYDMVAQVIQMFVMPAASKFFAAGEKHKLSVIIEKSISFSSLLLLPVFLGIILFPQFFIHLIYSGKYDHAAVIFQIFGILALIVPWNSAFAAALIGIGRVELGFYLGLIVTTVFLVLSRLMVVPLSAAGVALALILSNLVSVLGLSIYTKRHIGYKSLNVILRIKDAWMFARNLIISTEK